MGVDSSMRRPTWLTNLVDDPQQVLVVAEGDVGEAPADPVFSMYTCL